MALFAFVWTASSTKTQLANSYARKLHSEIVPPHAATAPAECIRGLGAGVNPDPEAWLDPRPAQGEYPEMTPSQYSVVHGLEPFERPDLIPWELHTYPTDDWYDRAKRATDECDLELTYQAQGASNGLEDKIVLVSGLVNLGRNEVGEFQRRMDEYYLRLQGGVLNTCFQMVIFISPEVEKHLTIDYTRVKVIHMNATFLRTFFPYWDRVQSIRTSKLWKRQAEITGWLEHAPQAKLEGYDPFSMSKQQFLLIAARLNPWGARYHIWVDASLLCMGELRPERTSMYRRHMASAFYMAHWPYGTSTEVRRAMLSLFFYGTLAVQEIVGGEAMGSFRILDGALAVWDFNGGEARGVLYGMCCG